MNTFKHSSTSLVSKIIHSFCEQKTRVPGRTHHERRQIVVTRNSQPRCIKLKKKNTDILIPFRYLKQTDTNTYTTNMKWMCFMPIQLGYKFSVLNIIKLYLITYNHLTHSCGISHIFSPVFLPPPPSKNVSLTTTHKYIVDICNKCMSLPI